MTKKKKLKILAIVFLIGLVVVMLGGHPLVSMLNPSITPQDLKTLYSYNEEFKPQVIRPGTNVTVRVPIELTSIGGFYTLDDIVFVPSDNSEAPWDCGGRRPYWAVAYAMIDHSDRRVSEEASVGVPVPNNSELEGKMVEGTLKMDLIYPVRVGTEHFRDHCESLEKQVSFYVFSSGQANLLNWVSTVWNILFAFFFFGLIALLVMYRRCKQPSDRSTLIQTSGIGRGELKCCDHGDVFGGFDLRSPIRFVLALGPKQRRYVTLDRSTTELDTGEWLFVSFDATQQKNVPVFIKAPNNEEIVSQDIGRT